MRLIDANEGHLFVLPPDNVILLAPRRTSAPLVLKFDDAAPPPRSLTVHCGRGCEEVTWVLTASGWRRHR